MMMTEALLEALSFMIALLLVITSGSHFFCCRNILYLVVLAVAEHVYHLGHTSDLLPVWICRLEWMITMG